MKKDGRTGGKNTKKAMEKASYFRELLSKDPYLKTEDARQAIVKLFGRGMTAAKMNSIRWKEFGIKFGSRGTVWNAKGERVLPTMPAISPAAVVQDHDTATPQAQLSMALKELRLLMLRAHVKDIHVPIEGPVQEIVEVEQTLNVNL